MTEIRGTRWVYAFYCVHSKMYTSARPTSNLFALFVGPWNQWPFFPFVQFSHPDISHRRVWVLFPVFGFFCLVGKDQQRRTSYKKWEREWDLWSQQSRQKKKGYPKVPCFDTGRPLSVLFWGFVGWLLVRDHVTDPFREGTKQYSYLPLPAVIASVFWKGYCPWWTGAKPVGQRSTSTPWKVNEKLFFPSIEKPYYSFSTLVSLKYGSLSTQMITIAFIYFLFLSLVLIQTGHQKLDLHERRRLRSPIRNQCDCCGVSCSWGWLCLWDDVFSTELSEGVSPFQETGRQGGKQNI